MTNPNATPRTPPQNTPPRKKKYPQPLLPAHSYKGGLDTATPEGPIPSRAHGNTNGEGNETAYALELQTA